MRPVQLLMKAVWRGMMLLLGISVAEFGGTYVPLGDHGRRVVGEIVIATVTGSAGTCGVSALL